jgi:hypothetical protein
LRSDLIRGFELIREHCSNFGLEVHIARDEIQSKSECMYIPEPGRFALDQQNTLKDSNNPTCSPSSRLQLTGPNESTADLNPPYPMALATMSNDPQPPVKTPRESEKTKKIRCDTAYDNCTETTRIVFADECHANFTKEFT